MKDGSHGSWSGRTSTRSLAYYYSLVRIIYYFDLRGLWCVSTTRAPLGRVRIGLAHGQSQQERKRKDVLLTVASLTCLTTVTKCQIAGDSSFFSFWKALYSQQLASLACLTTVTKGLFGNFFSQIFFHGYLYLALFTRRRDFHHVSTNSPHVHV